MTAISNKITISDNPISLNKITKEERRRLNYLTLKYTSLMRDDVLHATKNLHCFQLFFAKDKNKIIGWAVVFPGYLSTDYYKSNQKHFVYTYIQRAYRRKGIGKMLLTKVSNWTQMQELQIEVFAWDQQSEHFFSSCQKHLPIEMVVDYV